MISKVEIERFKNLENVSLELRDINVLIGGNNSGKSSVAHAIQFAVSVAQALSMAEVRWSKKGCEASLAPAQFPYTPTREIAALAKGGRLSEALKNSISVKFTETEQLAGPIDENGDETEPEVREHTAVLTVLRGRGQHIRCKLTGTEVGKKLQNTTVPFAFLVPGLAGLHQFEEVKPPLTIRKAAARGDANAVFRNILRQVKVAGTDAQKNKRWKDFLEAINSVFPGVTLRVRYETAKDEHVHAEIVKENVVLPIDCAGTGLLQTLQILAYIFLYRPRLLILDEPDAHLHPDNQKRLAKLLAELSFDRNFQLIIATHSRYLLEALKDSAQVIWMQNGTAKLVREDSDIEVLLELGALSRGDRLQGGLIKCVVLTEDEVTEPIRAVLESNGFQLVETDIWPYRGSTKVDTIKSISKILQQIFPGTQILVHKDRDYYTQEEIDDYIRDIHNLVPEAEVWVTPGTSIESCFLVNEHIWGTLGLAPGPNQPDYVGLATTDTEKQSKKKFINNREPIARRKIPRGSNFNLGEFTNECYDNYAEEPFRYTDAKAALNYIKTKIHGSGPRRNLIVSSPALACEQLTAVAARVWPELEQ